MEREIPQELLRHTLLSPPEERRLLERAQNGNRQQRKQARDELVLKNQRLVLRIAACYLGYGVPLSDLVQEGTLGLMRAIRKFDLSRETSFAVYASYWIRMRIRRAARRQSQTIAIPNYLLDRRWKVKQTRELLRQKYGMEFVPCKETCLVTGLPPQQVHAALDVPTVVSLDQPLNPETRQGDEEDEFPSLGKFLADPGPGPEEQTLQTLLSEEVNWALAQLSEKERAILTLRFGLSGGVPLTLEGIGEIFGLTKERIRQIEEEALDKLRKMKFVKALRR